MEFINLPLEIKLSIIECDPLHAIKLLLVDREIYTFSISDQGKNWINRITAKTYINTPEHKGILYFNKIRHGEWKFYKKLKLSKLHTYNFGKLHGPRYSFHKNRCVASHTEYVNDVINGISKTYYKNNVIKSEIPYKDGVKHGLFISYHENKNIHEKGSFVSGKKEGIHLCNYKNGDNKFLETYEKGQLSGKCEYRLENGNISFIKEYKDNIMIREEQYCQNKLVHVFHKDGDADLVDDYYYGSIMYQHRRVNGVRDGMQMQYDKDGHVVDEILYDMGTKINEKSYAKKCVILEIVYIKGAKTYEIAYSRIGEKTYEIHYDENSIMRKDYFSSGQIRAYTYWKNNKLHGMQIGYYENGNVSMKKCYVDGKKHGAADYYSQNGNTEIKLEFDQNVMVKSITYYNTGSKNQKVCYSNDKAISVKTYPCHDGIPNYTQYNIPQYDPIIS